MYIYIYAVITYIYIYIYIYVITAYIYIYIYIYIYNIYIRNNSIYIYTHNIYIYTYIYIYTHEQFEPTVFEVGTNGDGVILLYIGLCKWQITVIITKPNNISLCVQPCFGCGCSEFNKRTLECVLLSGDI